jgi:hypothetical protein
MTMRHARRHRPSDTSFRTWARKHFGGTHNDVRLSPKLTIIVQGGR